MSEQNPTRSVQLYVNDRLVDFYVADGDLAAIEVNEVGDVFIDAARNTEKHSVGPWGNDARISFGLVFEAHAEPAHAIRNRLTDQRDEEREDG